MTWFVPILFLTAAAAVADHELDNRDSPAGRIL